MTDFDYTQDIHAFCANGDGTYDGIKVFMWLYHLGTKGKTISYEDAAKEVAAAIAKRKAVR